MAKENGEQREHEELRRLMRKNQELIEENQKILHKLYRVLAVSFWARVFWFLLLIGLPFAVYFYFLEPYFQAFGSSYEQFRDGFNELPGIKSYTL